MTKVRGGLIQMALKAPTEKSPEEIRNAMLDAHAPLIEKAGGEGVQILCFQEVFTQPYFCPSQDAKWYAAAERIPDGPTVKLMQDFAKKYQMVIVVPIYEEAMTGVYYNTAAVIDADGSYMGKYRKTHIPQVAGFWEKFFFKPGASEFPVFKTRYCRLGVYICYDRHFPEGWRALALNGADYIVNPSATVAGLSEYLWKLEQPASAVANGVYIGAINRIGKEAPWNIGEFKRRLPADRQDSWMTAPLPGPDGPGASIAGMLKARVASRTIANCGIRSSGGSGRCALYSA